MASDIDRERAPASRDAETEEDLQAVVDRYESVLAKRERLHRAERDARCREEAFVWSGPESAGTASETAADRDRSARTDGGPRHGLLARLRDLF